MSEELKNRLMSKIKIDTVTGCWNWTAARKKDEGYGQIWFGGQAKGTHRVSYELHCGQIPNGLHVLHRCDNPSCINPDHLFLGTNKDNVDDRVAKGRQLRGSKHCSAKLSESDVVFILTAKNMTGQQLADRYGVAPPTIYNIRAGRRWAHVTYRKEA